VRVEVVIDAAARNSDSLAATEALGPPITTSNKITRETRRMSFIRATQGQRSK
jgi:hypothetical protein